MAEGSLEESRYYLILSQDLGYGKTEELHNLLEEVSRLLTATHTQFWLLAPEFWLPYPWRASCE
jgi:four helix bundle protein